jgi:hypothetical protein
MTFAQEDETWIWRNGERFFPEIVIFTIHASNSHTSAGEGSIGVYDYSTKTFDFQGQIGIFTDPEQAAEPTGSSESMMKVKPFAQNGI